VETSNAMTDANADGIWEVTVSIPGGNYEYKFAYDSWAGQRKLDARFFLYNDYRWIHKPHFKSYSKHLLYLLFVGKAALLAL